jgi:predicted nucleic acid-binding protein
MLNLDTHVLLYALTDNLTARERALLTGETWSISAIVLREIAKLSELVALKST